MKDLSETKRLADAVAVIARTIMDLIDAKLRELAQAENAGSSGINRPNPAEVWVGKREAAVHLKISQRTLDAWMRRGFVPFIKIGRNIRFKLSDVDEAMKTPPWDWLSTIVAGTNTTFLSPAMGLMENASLTRRR